MRLKNASCPVGCCCPLCDSEMAAAMRLAIAKDQTFYARWLQQAQDALLRKFGVTRAAGSGSRQPWRTFRTSGPQSGPIETRYADTLLKESRMEKAPPPPDMREAILARDRKATITSRERISTAVPPPPDLGEAIRKAERKETR